MRRAFDPQWVYLPDGSLAGVALGSDACAEHEWGVGPMRHDFGCDDTADGIKRRQITKQPSDLQREIKDTYDCILLADKQWRSIDAWVNESHQFSKTQKHGKDWISCAWDEKSFGIVAYGDKDRKNIKTLWEAFKNLDIAFYPNIGVFHVGPGLVFAIVSKMPEENVKEILKADLDHKELLRKSEETGIAKKLEQAKKRYMALSPRWSKGHSDMKTTHPVIYWLNPYNEANYGWYTVEQLEQWIKNEGPIPKKQGQRSER